MFLFSGHIRFRAFVMAGAVLFSLVAGQVTVSASQDSKPGPVVSIIIRETSFVNKEKILLGQISDIAAMGFLKESLEKIELGKSPKPGQIKTFNRSKIVAVIQSQKYLPENTTIQSPDRIYVKRSSQTVSKSDIRQFVDQSLAQYFFKKEFEITAFNVRGLAAYPQGKITFQADPADMVDRKGRLSFFLDLLINGRKVDRVSVKGSVALYENVFHASRALEKGQTISRADVHTDRKNIFELDSDCIFDFKAIEKMILKTNLKQGDYLKTSVLTEPFLVKKGDRVTLVARKDNLVIRTTGICREDGFENELVKVENLTSGELITGVVTDKSSVEVVY